MIKSVFQDEKKILSELSKGNVIAFRLIFDSHRQNIYNNALKLTKSSELAEEIVQDVFMIIWERRHLMSDVENLGAYIRIMARNRAFKELKRLAQMSEFTQTLPSDVHVDPVAEQVLLNDTMGVLKKAIQQLPQRQRSVYELCYLKGLKYHEAAEELNISVLTVKSHMQRALFSVRRFMSSNQILSALIFLAAKFTIK